MVRIVINSLARTKSCPTVPVCCLFASGGPSDKTTAGTVLGEIEMRVLICGGDGYLGWPTAMVFAAKGHEVMVTDNYLRRTIARSTRSEALVEAPNLDDRAEIFHSVTGHRIEVRI